MIDVVLFLGGFAVIIGWKRLPAFSRGTGKFFGQTVSMFISLKDHWAKQSEGTKWGELRDEVRMGFYELNTIRSEVRQAARRRAWSSTTMQKFAAQQQQHHMQVQGMTAQPGIPPAGTPQEGGSTPATPQAGSPDSAAVAQAGLTPANTIPQAGTQPSYGGGYGGMGMDSYGRGSALGGSGMGATGMMGMGMGQYSGAYGMEVGMPSRPQPPATPTGAASPSYQDSMRSHTSQESGAPWQDHASARDGDFGHDQIQDPAYTPPRMVTAAAPVGSASLPSLPPMPPTVDVVADDTPSGHSASPPRDNTRLGQLAMAELILQEREAANKQGGKVARAAQSGEASGSDLLQDVLFEGFMRDHVDRVARQQEEQERRGQPSDAS